MEYYSVVKREEVHATAWTNLEKIILSERSQAQKSGTCRMIPFIGNVQRRQIYSERCSFLGLGKEV